MDLSCEKWGMEQLKQNGLTVLDTFCGAGIGACGMLLAGFDTVYAFDIKDYAVKTYNRNFGIEAGFKKNPAHLKDVKDVNKYTLPEKIDVITGGVPCFYENTLILTKSGYKKIKDIVPGDFVLTHRGKYRKVVTTMKKWTQKVYTIETRIAKEIITTEEHPFYVIRKKKSGKFSKPKWVKAANLNNWYYVGIPINKKATIPKIEAFNSNITKSKIFWWIVAKYIKNKIDDSIINFKEDSTKILKFLNVNNIKYEDLGPKGIRITDKRFIEYVNENSRITADLISLPVDYIKIILGELLNNKNIIYTSSEKFAYAIGQCILKAYNKPYSIRSLFGGLIYIINILHADDISFIKEGYLWTRVDLVLMKERNIIVYNLEVEEDNSYTVYNIAVHNCQPFSLAGKGDGSKNKKMGNLALEFCRLVDEIKPKAFLFENVGGLITKNHLPFFYHILERLEASGYNITYPTKKDKKSNEILTTINCWDYGVPQTRERIFVVGIRKDVNSNFKFPEPIPVSERKDLRYAIFDIKDLFETNKIPNHDKCYTGGYSSRYLSRNRQRQWNEPSFTIVSEARQLPLYPEPENYDIRKKEEYDKLGILPPRRFTVRECLRIQTVPDWFSFSDEIKLEDQYERCSGIPSLIAYKFGIEIAKIIS